MALVSVKPIEEAKWHGKSGKENFSRPKTYEVLYDEATGKYATGLTEDERLEFEAKMGVNLSDIYVQDQAHPYWSSKAAFIVLPNHTKIFDTRKPVEAVKVKNMKASKYVANSLKEFNEGKWPFATHIIFDENEEVEEKALESGLKRKLYRLVDKMDKDSQIAMILVTKNKNLKGRSDSFVNAEIEAIAESKEDREIFLKYAEMGKEEVLLRSQIIELLQKNILSKDGTNIMYLGEKLGYDLEDTLNWFRNPENNKMKIIILDKLNK